MQTPLLLVLVGFSAGFVDAVAGGGGLISLPSLLSLGLPPVMALGTNKAIGFSTALASSSRYRFAKLISWRELSPLLVLSFSLSMLGAFVATRVDPTILRPVIFVLLVIAGLVVLLKNKFGLERKVSRFNHWTWVVVPAIGFYDGFFGPGTGTFLMMTFVLLAGNELLTASAKSRLINLSTSVAALLWFSSQGHVQFRWVWPAAIASFVGGLLGAQLALRKGAQFIRPIFVLVTWGLITKVAFDLF